MGSGGTIDIYLAVGMTDLHDSLCLHDGTSYWYPATQTSIGGASLPGGIQFSTHPRGVYEQAGNQQPTGTKTIALAVMCEGASMNQVEQNYRAVHWKIEQARRAASPSPRGTQVYLWYRPSGATQFVYFPVVGGIFTYQSIGLVDGALIKAGVLQLFSRPYAIGDPIPLPATATFQAGDPANWPYFAGIAGDVESVGRVNLTDKTTDGSAINRLRIGVRTSRPMLATDFNPVYNLTPASPGASQVDAGAWGGHSSRLAAGSITTSPQNIARTDSAAGAHQNGTYELWGPVKDSSAPPATPAVSSVVGSGAGGNLTDGEYLAMLTAYDGSAHESFPSAAQAVTVPITSTSFFTSGEEGDLSQWTAQKFVFGGTGIQGNINVEADAAYSSGVPNDDLGYRALSGLAANGPSTDVGGSYVYTQIPGGGQTGAIRSRLRVNSASGTADQRIVLAVDSSFNPLYYLRAAGGGWSLCTVSGGLEVSLGIAQITQGDWLRVELRITAWNGGTLRSSYAFFVNDVSVLSGAVGASTQVTPWGFSIGAETVGNSVDTAASALSVDFDDVQVSASAIGANAGSIAFAWSAAANATGYNLYFQREDGSFRKVDVGNVTSYTLTSNTAGSIVTAGPPLGAPPVQFAQLRCAFELAGTGPLPYYTPPVSTQIGGSVWELVRLAQGITLPPIAPQQGGSPPPWTLVVQGASGGTNTPNLDVSEVFLFPSDEANVTITVPTTIALTSPAQFQIDVNDLGYVTCQIFTADGATRIGQAVCTGRLTLGPGDTILTVLPEVSDGAGHYVWDVNAKYQLQVTYTPRYDHWRGVA